MAEKESKVNIKVTGTEQVDKASKSIDKTAESLAKVADNSVKVSKGFAGGFESATKAANIFGKDAGAAFEKATTQAQAFMQVSNGLKDAAEGFSKENIKGLTGIFQGFTKAGIGAKLFGTVTKAAITSTGIGALVVLVGTLAANWDSVTEAVGDFIDSIPFLKSISDSVDALIEKVGSLSNLFSAIGDFVVAAFTSGKDAVEEFNKSLERGKAIEKLQQQAELLDELNNQRSVAIKLLEAMGKQEEEIFRLQKEAATESLKNLNDRIAAGEELSKEDKKRVSDLQAEIILIGIREQKWKDSLDAEAKKKAEEREKERKAEQEARDKALEAFMKEVEKEIDENKKAQEKMLDDFIKSAEKEADEQNKLLAERLKAEAQAATNIQKLRIEGLEEGLEKEIALLNFYRNEELKNVQGTEEQKNQQRELINAKFRKAANEAELKDFDNKQKELFAKISEYAGIAGDAASTIIGVFSEKFQQEIEGIQYRLDAINSQYLESATERDALNAELANAEGDRRELILKELDKEKAKEKELAAERKRLQNQQIAAQNKKNQADYVNSIIQATISTAQAVLQALASSPPPASFILAAIAGALGGIQIGVIAGNKPKEIPPVYADGGFTSAIGPRDHTGFRVAGVVHEGEYVVPAHVLNSNRGSSLVGQLEGMRQSALKPYADGGIVTPSLDTSSSFNSNQFLADSISNMRLAVAVTEFNEVAGRVSVIEDTASL